MRVASRACCSRGRRGERQPRGLHQPRPDHSAQGQVRRRDPHPLPVGARGRGSGHHAERTFAAAAPDYFRARRVRQKPARVAVSISARGVSARFAIAAAETVAAAARHRSTILGEGEPVGRPRHRDRRAAGQAGVRVRRGGREQAARTSVAPGHRRHRAAPSSGASRGSLVTASARAHRSPRASGSRPRMPAALRTLPDRCHRRAVLGADGRRNALPPSSWHPGRRCTWQRMTRCPATETPWRG